MNTKFARVLDRKVSSARDLRRQDKIRQIAQAATEVFLEVGFAAASMDKIVEKAGVSKRTLYKYYDSKEEIFIDVVQMELDSMWKNFEPDSDVSEDLAGQLQRIGVELLRIANAPVTLSLFRVTAAEAQRFPKLAYQFFNESYEKVIDGIAEILERQTSGPAGRIADKKQAAEYFLDLLTGTEYLRIIFGSKAPLTEKAMKARTRRALDFFYETYKLK